MNRWISFESLSLATLLVLSGCGASALDRTERVYGVLHAVQSETVARFEDRTRERVREACPTGEESCALAVAAEHHAALRAECVNPDGSTRSCSALDLSADALDTAGRELIRWALTGKEMSSATCTRIREAITALGHAMQLVTALGTDLSSLGIPAWTCPGE
jgi:hypothetical protein